MCSQCENYIMNASKFSVKQNPYRIHNSLNRDRQSAWSDQSQICLSEDSRKCSAMGVNTHWLLQETKTSTHSAVFAVQSTGFREASLKFYIGTTKNPLRSPPRIFFSLIKAVPPFSVFYTLFSEDSVQMKRLKSVQCTFYPWSNLIFSHIWFLTAVWETKQTTHNQTPKPWLEWLLPLRSVHSCNWHRKSSTPFKFLFLQNRDVNAFEHNANNWLSASIFVDTCQPTEL